MNHVPTYQDKAHDVARRLVGKVSIKRHEVTSAHVLAELKGAPSVDVDDIISKVGKSIWSRTAEPIVRECVVQEEWLDVSSIGSLDIGTIRETTEHECPLSKGHCKVLDTGVEVWVRGASGIVGALFIRNHGFDSKEASSRCDGIVADGLPAFGNEVSLVLEIIVRAGHGSIDLKSSMLVKPKSRAESVGDARICATDSIFAGN